jgi:hypothetical protein
MNSTELAAFERFWDLVRRAEQDIRENPRLPTPGNWGDPLDEKDHEFLQSYKKIKPYLAKFRRKRLFLPPANLMLRSGAYSAETAHEALMFFLHHPTDYEYTEVLNSPEYLSIKVEAQAELKDRQESLDRSAARSMKSTSEKAEIEHDVGTLYQVIRDHMIIAIREEHPKPLNWKELRDRLPQDPKAWSQPKISRTMAKLLDAPRANGMRAYQKLFRSREGLKGIISRDAAGNRNVDASVEDSPLEN